MGLLSDWWLVNVYDWFCDLREGLSQDHSESSLSRVVPTENGVRSVRIERIRERSSTHDQTSSFTVECLFMVEKNRH